MSGETDVSLKEYVEARFNAMDKALELYTANNNNRLDHMNEFREENKNLSITKISTDACESYRASIDKELRPLRKAIDVMEGKASQRSVYIAWLIAIIGIGLAIVSIGIQLGTGGN